MEHPFSLQSALEFALEATWQAGHVTLRYFQTPVPVETKSDNSPVTVADKEAEQLLRHQIGKQWPTHGIIGEEFGAAESDYTWIIDPIDGTKSFIHGVPFYAVLLALVKDRKPLVGIAHFPALNETIYAAQGMGCYWNGRRAHVSSVDKLADACLLASEPPNSRGRDWHAIWDRLATETRIQRTWGDAYGYALVATGRAEIMLDAAMKVWDCAPLQVILEEAGGSFTDWQGTPTIYGHDSVATNAALKEATLALFKQPSG
ncbi:MAG: inositol monophosphatase family protein [Anaerolineae bacterium]|nr:inositol monophosphatase family protein [Anaerolineae bacterium]